MKYKIHSTVLREGKYEIFYDILDDKNNLLLGNLIYTLTDSYPNKEDLDILFNDIIFEKIESDLLKEVNLDSYYSTSEITQILRDKNYIGPDEEFSEDMTVNG